MRDCTIAGKLCANDRADQAGQVLRVNRPTRHAANSLTICLQNSVGIGPRCRQHPLTIRGHPGFGSTRKARDKDPLAHQIIR